MRLFADGRQLITLRDKKWGKAGAQIFTVQYYVGHRNLSENTYTIDALLPTNQICRCCTNLNYRQLVYSYPSYPATPNTPQEL